MNPLLQLRTAGQQIWLDNLSRALLNDGHLARMIADDAIAGVTTNPSIFHKAISGGRYYEEDLASLKHQALTPEARYERLVIPDVQRACDLLETTFRNSDANAGYVSLEVSPALAHDTAGTVAAGVRLKQEVARNNLLIKIPGTDAGVQATEELVARGVSVNVTLLFSRAHVNAVASAYIRGLQRLHTAGGDPGAVMSVASLFLSRVDTLVDRELESRGPQYSHLQGKSALALAKLAYQDYLERFHGREFAALRQAGARPQFLLWASTGTKNPRYSDLLYVEGLIGPETINTLPDATLDALRDHGRVARTIALEMKGADQQFDALQAAGLDMTAIGDQLQREGLKQFDVAFEALLTLTN